MPRPEQTGLKVSTLFDGLVVQASGTVYSSPVALSYSAGYVSLFLQNTGTGLITLDYELSLDNSRWAQVETPPLNPLSSSFSSTSGPTSDGKTYIYFEPPAAAWLRFKVTETAAANTVVYLTVGVI